MSEASFYQRFTWCVVAAKDVLVGDLIANQATVTEVVRGPRMKADRYFDRVKRGETLIRCGDSWAMKGRSSRLVIVGRDYKAGASLTALGAAAPTTGECGNHGGPDAALPQERETT